MVNERGCLASGDAESVGQAVKKNRMINSEKINRFMIRVSQWCIFFVSWESTSAMLTDVLSANLIDRLRRHLL